MSKRKKIESILREQPFSTNISEESSIYSYAKGISLIEKSIVVVSDLKSGTSKIFNGSFSGLLGLNDDSDVDSIWENEILKLMTPEECEEKYLAELRFYNFLRLLPPKKRTDYYLATTLRFSVKNGTSVDVLHRMYYFYEDNSDVVRYGICIYGPQPFTLPSRCLAINALTGKWVELTAATDNKILSVREKEVLMLIERGLTSQAIASELCISRNTVNRHRQEIIAKLQVSNSTEACRRAKQLNII